ncbi:alkene reductase [Marinigracilibium pacificum]|uniref:Alkene reductase n=1 Tax=Marinigracilibium pacificum TaxID=2729599 RepID=A0A848IX43_9BACT|nr:alkene reductase [Marinigracilibium pacificum]NMM48226.1 alkene reductase [Marinigracilibium pacificum]
MHNVKPLLKPYKSNINLKNRVVMAPMTRSRANNEGNIPNDLMVEYYRQRATAGLIITEGAPISPKAIGYINVPGIYTQNQVEGWKKVTESVHKEGGTIYVQLWHVGRISHPDFHNGELPLAPSAINPNEKSFTPEGFKETVTPKEMTIEDIKSTIEDFKNAAVNAKEAGFDGIEIHASNGYLLHQFFASTSNKRSDEYGGTIENRSKILFEILDEIKKAVPDLNIGVRLNPSLHGIFGMTLNEDTIPTFDYIVNKLNDYDLAYLHLSEPFNDVSEVPFAEPKIAERYRKIYNGTLMINANFDQEKGNEVIEKENADLVAYGKLFISNPDLVKRFELDAPLNDYDQNTFYTPGPEGYIDYPMLEDKVETK